MAAEQFGPRWKKTKELYEKTVGQKKPAEKILKVFRKSTDIESGLKAFDEAARPLGKGDDRKASEKALPVLVKAHAAAASSIKSYLALLEKTIDEDKQADPAYTLGLKMLKADLKAITDGMAKEVETSKDAIEQWEIITPEQSAAFTAKQDKKLISTMVLGIKTVYAATLKARAQANAEFYNATVPQSIREGLVEMQPRQLDPATLKALQPKKPYPQREIVHVFTYCIDGDVRASNADDVKRHCDAITHDLAIITQWVKSMPGAPA